MPKLLVKGKYFTHYNESGWQDMFKDLYLNMEVKKW
jgi:hypothetical protein